MFKKSFDFLSKMKRPVCCGELMLGRTYRSPTWEDKSKVEEEAFQCRHCLRVIEVSVTYFRGDFHF